MAASLRRQLSFHEEVGEDERAQYIWPEIQEALDKGHIYRPDSGIKELIHVAWVRTVGLSHTSSFGIPWILHLQFEERVEELFEYENWKRELGLSNCPEDYKE